MPQRMYLPLSKLDRIPKNVFESLYSTINEAIDVIKPERHEFILLGTIIIVKSDLEEPIEQVKVYSKKDSKNNDSVDVPEEIKNAINRLKIDHDLTQKEIIRLTKELRKSEFEKLDINKQIQHLEKRAKVLGNQRYRDKLKREFETNYEKFFQTLSTELLDLEKKDKQDIRVLLENMSAIIKDTIYKLD